MKRFALLIILSFSFLFFSCDDEEIIEGCTDPVACNYDSNATDLLLGSCNYPLESVLEFTYSDDLVTGLVGEDVISHVHIRNSSCEAVSIKARKIFTSTDEYSAYFCFADVCFGSDVTVSPTTLTLESFEEDDYFKGYFNSSVPGTYEVLYRFYLENNPDIYIEKVIVYEISVS